MRGYYTTYCLWIDLVCTGFLSMVLTSWRRWQVCCCWCGAILHTAYDQSLVNYDDNPNQWCAKTPNENMDIVMMQIYYVEWFSILSAGAKYGMSREKRMKVVNSWTKLNGRIGIGHWKQMNVQLFKWHKNEIFIYCSSADACSFYHLYLLTLNVFMFYNSVSGQFSSSIFYMVDKLLLYDRKQDSLTLLYDRHFLRFHSTLVWI